MVGPNVIAKCRLILLFFSVIMLLKINISPHQRSSSSVDAATITAPEKLVNFTKRYFTIFLSDEQLWKENDVVGYGFFSLQTQGQIGKNMSDTFTSSLVGAAGLKAMQKLQCLFIELGGPTQFQEAIDHVTEVISNASKPVYNQIIAKVTGMKAQTRGPNAQHSQIYRMCAQWWTQYNICVIMRWGNRYMPPKESAALKKCLDDVVWFRNCGL